MDTEVLFKPGSENGMMGSSGLTSRESNRRHNYTVDENGNGWTTPASVPGYPEITHRHRISNFEVLEAQSGCYPDCKDQYGADGSPPHQHAMLDVKSE
jgi:hypothetical protein